jgi:hypothetical protein
MADEEKEVQQPAAKEKVKEKEELEAIIGDPAATYKVVKDHLSHSPATSRHVANSSSSASNCGQICWKMISPAMNLPTSSTR